MLQMEFPQLHVTCGSDVHFGHVACINYIQVKLELLEYGIIFELLDSVCKKRESFLESFVCPVVLVSWGLFGLDFLGEGLGSGFPSAVGLSVEVGEEGEEDRCVEEEQCRYQFGVAAVENEGLGAVHENQEELDLLEKSKLLSCFCG